MITQADSVDPGRRRSGELRKSLDLSPVFGSVASEYVPWLEWRAKSCS